MASQLLDPLGAMIVAVRTQSPNASAWLIRFNEQADVILPQIRDDVSVSANLLHSAIVNVRANPRDLDVLERARLDLLDIR